jgi:PAS domain S-box-containing protein
MIERSDSPPDIAQSGRPERSAGSVRSTGSISEVSDAKRDIATVLDAIPGLVAILTPGGEVDAVNHELIAYCGQPLESMRQWGTNGTVHQEDLPRVAAVFTSAIAAGEPYDFDARIRRFDGSYRWNQVRGLPFRDSSGQIVRWYVLLSEIDDSKRAEEALRESEKRYERAMLAAEAGFWDWDVPADEFYVSPKLLEMTDFPAGTRFASRADFMARAPFHSDDLAKWERAVKELFASGGTHLAMEIRSIHGGETRWALLSGMCVRDPAGKILRWTGSATDVTARKRAEEALRESEKRYERVMLASAAGLWDWDVVHDNYYVSPQMLAMSGIPLGTTFHDREEFMQRSPFYPEDREKYQQAVRELIAGSGTRLAMEVRLLVNGETRWFNLVGMCFRNAEGKALRWTGSATDITEQKRALRSRQELLEVAQNAARAAAFEWRVGPSEGENRWSPDLEAMHGIPAGSYDGTYESWKKLVHPEDWANVQAAIQAAQETGDVDAEYRVLDPGGTIRWLQAKGRMFFDPDGKPTRIVGFVLDVTDRRLAEEDVERMERQLRQAQRLEALGTLAGGIAHDFNNLLGAILGYGEMALRDARAGTRLRRDIESMIIAGERGRALVDRILAFSRSGIGEQIAVHVQEVMRETLALFAAKLPEHIVIERRLHAAGAAVVGDPTQIHQVLMNLLTNAVQAMPSGGTLRVSLDRIHHDAPRIATTGSIAAREYVVMEVSDSGSGIPAEIIERIFDPFFTTKEVGVGTGLGLSLVHGIVTGLGGAIDVATTVGTGSVFKVYLPVADDLVVTRKPRKRPERRSDHTGRGRVMVIDDEEALVRLATEALVESGYSAVGFTSGAKAIDAFLADPGQFDAVITDESMPGMSGSELIGKMRALRPTLPILLMSGYLNAALIERAREAGATEVLSKPLPARQLRVALERVLLPASDPSMNASSKLSRPVAKPRRGDGPSRQRSAAGRDHPED